MSQWYVYRQGLESFGPLSTDAVAEEMLAGRLPTDVWVAPPGGVHWVRAIDVPVIVQSLEGIATTRPGRPDFGSTMMIVDDAELAFDRGTTPEASTARPFHDTAEMSALPAMSVRLPRGPDDDSSGKLER